VTESFTLITGRTREQADGLHKGKDSEAYRIATTLAEMSPEDMNRLAIKDGQIIRLKSAAHFVELPVRSGTLPPGMIFVPMGPVANALIGSETAGTGMPSFKGLKVEMELA